MISNLVAENDCEKTIICTEIQDSPLLQKAAFGKLNRFVHATIDSKNADYLPFPNYQTFAPCFLPQPFEAIADRIHNFTVRPDDIWIITFPKSGTTWMQNIVQYLTNKMDFSSPLLTPKDIYLEYDMLLPNFDRASGQENQIKSALKMLEDQPSPRIIKSHLPVHLLPKQIWSVHPKIIYVARNPKDVAVSMFHFRKSCKVFSGTIDEFGEIFMNDFVISAPIHRHVLDFWRLRHLDFVLFLTYEELSADRFECIKGISKFLGHSYDENQLRKLAEFVSFDSMKEKIESSNSTATDLR